MIFYFSGTGNTRWAASTISSHTGDRLVDISKEPAGATYELEKDERIGFCFPVHGWRPPMIVRNFIRNMKTNATNGNYCYAVCTAGDNIGETINILRNDLSSVGIRLDSALSLIMPESYVGLPFMDVDTPAKEAEKKRKAAIDLERFTEVIMSRTTGVEELTKGRWPRINSRIIGGFFTNHLITDKPFHVTEGKCIGCGACARACPVGNILGGDGNAPQWKHDGSCLACFSCYHHCPVHAIEYGRRTKKKGQYYFK